MTHVRTLRRGIYPLIVKVVLVVITLITALILVSYIFSLVTTTKEQFEIKPLLYITYTGLSPEPVLTLYVLNAGARSETLLRVEIITGSGIYRCDLNYDINAGFKGYLLIARSRSSESGTYVRCDWEIDGNPVIVDGDFYTIKLYTAKHGTLTLITVAQKSA